MTTNNDNALRLASASCLANRAELAIARAFNKGLSIPGRPAGSFGNPTGRGFEVLHGEVRAFGGTAPDVRKLIDTDPAAAREIAVRLLSVGEMLLDRSDDKTRTREARRADRASAVWRLVDAAGLLWAIDGAVAAR